MLFPLLSMRPHDASTHPEAEADTNSESDDVGYDVHCSILSKGNAPANGELLRHVRGAWDVLRSMCFGAASWVGGFVEMPGVEPGSCRARRLSVAGFLLSRFSPLPGSRRPIIPGWLTNRLPVAWVHHTERNRHVRGGHVRSTNRHAKSSQCDCIQIDRLRNTRVYLHSLSCTRCARRPTRRRRALSARS